jgi:hypothetical protein
MHRQSRWKTLADGDDAPIVLSGPALNVANVVSETKVLAVHHAPIGSALDRFSTPVGVLPDARLGRRQLLPQGGDLGGRGRGTCRRRGAVDHNDVC